MFYVTKNNRLFFLVMGSIIFISLCAADKEHTTTLYTVARDGIIGGIAGGVEPLLTQPIINVKIQRQQGKHIGDIITLVRRNPSALYRGLGVNMVCSVPSIATQIAFDAAIKDTVPSHNIISLMAQNTIIGSFSALTCNSTELVIINQQNNVSPAASIIKDLYRKHGITVFGRGFLSKAARESIFCMGFLTWYPDTKAAIEKQLNIYNSSGRLSGLNNLFSTVAASCLVGGPTALLSHPFDTVSTYLQADPGKKECKGYMDIIKATRQQGITSLYRGCGSRSFLIMLAIPILTSAKDAMKHIV